jgi:hypothetical protein
LLSFRTPHAFDDIHRLLPRHFCLTALLLFFTLPIAQLPPGADTASLFSRAFVLPRFLPVAGGISSI